MKQCVIIGGGLAGLSAASILSSKNINVTLIESSPKLGGRTYSFIDKETDIEIDNGQHIMMGCYKETLQFLKLIGAENNFDYQKNLFLKFIDRNKNHFQLNAASSFYPLNLLKAILNFDVLTSDDKISFITLLLKLPILRKNSLKKITVSEWLENENQNPNTIKNFWEILCVGALNTNLNKASAFVFYEVLMQIFYKGNFASTIILPKTGMSESIINPASHFLKNNGGEIVLSEMIKEVVIKNQRIVTLKSENKVYDNFDFVISAIPLYALEKIMSKNTLNINLELEYSTILNIHIWLKENNLNEKFYGLLDSTLHWIFVKEKHLNIVISDANYLTDKSREEIYDLVIEELLQYTSITKSDILKYKIIKEKRATFIPTIDTVNMRPNIKTLIKNLFLAGDWTNTGLPSTIESAVKSGRIAADFILNESL
jgi:squalene-associated FAD-dependent desaturase